MKGLTIIETYDFGEHVLPDGTRLRSYYLIPRRDAHGRPVDECEIVFIHPPDDDDEDDGSDDGQQGDPEPRLSPAMLQEI